MCSIYVFIGDSHSSIGAKLLYKRVHVHAVTLHAVVVPAVLGAARAILRLDRSGVMQDR
jgi:hypothetical protein